MQATRIQNASQIIRGRSRPMPVRAQWIAERTSASSLILSSFWREEDGQDLVEYSLLLAFIALAAVAALSGVGTSIKKMFNEVSNDMSNAVVAGS